MLEAGTSFYTRLNEVTSMFLKPSGWVELGEVALPSLLPSCRPNLLPFVHLLRSKVVFWASKLQTKKHPDAQLGPFKETSKDGYLLLKLGPLS